MCPAATRPDAPLLAGLPTSSPASLPIARMRSVYNLDEVSQRLDKLPEQDHEHLRATYARMLVKGSERFQVKPGGLPAMDRLYEELPNFGLVLDDIRRQLALCQDSGDALEITPMLLLGPPGIGKTHFARQIAQLLGTGLGFVSMSSLTAGWILSGSSSQWKGSRPGKVFETLVDGAYANPVMLVDEIDKARAEQAYDPLGALYSLLEQDTAGQFTDEFAEVAIDASQFIWLATANDERGIPAPILNRLKVFELDAPDIDAARAIALRLYQQLRAAHAWGERFDPEPSVAVLERMAALAPREMRRAWMTAFGNAKLAARDGIVLSDLPSGVQRRASIGFVH